MVPRKVPAVVLLRQLAEEQQAQVQQQQQEQARQMQAQISNGEPRGHFNHCNTLLTVEPTHQIISSISIF